MFKTTNNEADCNVFPHMYKEVCVKREPARVCTPVDISKNVPAL